MVMLAAMVGEVGMEEEAVVLLETARTTTARRCIPWPVHRSFFREVGPTMV